MYSRLLSQLRSPDPGKRKRVSATRPCSPDLTPCLRLRGFRLSGRGKGERGPSLLPDGLMSFWKGWQDATAEVGREVSMIGRASIRYSDFHTAASRGLFGRLSLATLRGEPENES